MEIKVIIKQKRLEKKYTQEQVAEKIFVSVKSISNWETGKNFPDIESLVRLALLYDLSLDDLLLEDSEIVKDIKKKSELEYLKKWSFWGPQLTNWLLILLLFVPRLLNETYSEITYLLIMLIIFSNFISILYFNKEINKLDPIRKVELLENKVFLIIIGILLLVAIAVPVTFYMFFLK